MDDQDYMQLALSLAERGRGAVSPNPMVGAVVIQEGKIIGQGWHEAFGGSHAERVALANCNADPRGATLYVTLEPCCHTGKTPPCTEAILESGIARVVVGTQDPNPLVGGKGISLLQETGVLVTTGVCAEQCRTLNRVFFHYISTKTPYVTLKYAMTLDGKLAAYTGESKWITGECARKHVHETRGNVAAIMVGSGTILQDDPLLTCRTGQKSPVRVICDTRLRTPLRAQVVATAHDVPTILATTCNDLSRLQPYQAAGCEIFTLDTAQDGHIDLHQLMKQLAQRGLDSVLLEGGAQMQFAMLHAGLVQSVQAYIAPKLLGGRDAPSPVGGCGFPSPQDAVQLSPPHITVFAEDLLLESEVLYDVHRNH